MLGRILVFGVLGLTALLLTSGTVARAEGEPTLESGSATRVRLPRGRRFWIGQIDVPEGARSLEIVATGTRDVDLYVAHGRPVTRRLTTADAVSRGSELREAIRLTSDESGALRPGTWYVTVVHPNCRRFSVGVEVLATLDRGDEPDAEVDDDAPGEAAVLEADVPLELVVGGADPVLRRVRIDVPADVAGFEILATNGAGADVDLFVRRGSRLTGEHDADYLSLASGPRDRLVVGGVRPLPAGAYHLEVVLVDGCGPVKVELTMRFLDAGSGRTTWGDVTLPVLEPGLWTQGIVDPGLPGVRWFRVDVPGGTRSLHAQLLDATAPLDLLLLRRGDGRIVSRALTSRVDERLDQRLRRSGEDRSFVLGVLNQNQNEPEVRFRIALSFDRPPAPPADLDWPPFMPGDDLSAQERIAAASVEVTVRGGTGGSGTCVGADGRILTCRHVLETGQPGRIQTKDILIAFPRSLDLPPVQGFLARVVHTDEDRDLALLQITGDVFGRPVAGLGFPWLPLARADPRLGDSLLVAGYPAEGSARSRTPVIVTRGAVAGLERRIGRLRWIKTDAWVGLGHSGGAVVNDRYEVVGVAAATLGPNDVLGLAVPVSAVPAAWQLGQGERPDTD